MEDPRQLISVIIPVTQMFGKLQNLELSIKAADPEIVQIIIVHDRRDEDTWLELREIIKRYDQGHIVAVDGVFGSAGAARNKGLELATNELIAFWDSDDLGDSSSLIKVSRETDWSKYSASVSSFSRVGDGGKTRNFIFSDEVKTNEYLIAAYPGIWRWLFLKSKINSRFKNFSMGEDQLFLAMNLKDLTITFNKIITYTYFTNVENQATGNINILKLRELSEVARELDRITESDSFRNYSIVKKMNASLNLSLFKYSQGLMRFKYLIKLIHTPQTAFIIAQTRKVNVN